MDAAEDSGPAPGGPAPAIFPIRVDPAFRPLFSLLGAGSRHDLVAVGPRGLSVRLGWMFRADIPWVAVGAVSHHPDMVGGWGAHGWRGRWLVNGSSHGIVEVEVRPPQRGWLIGVWPLTLRTLYLSLVDPDGFLRAVELAPRPPAAR